VRSTVIPVVLGILMIAGLSPSAAAGDWPMWRYDSGRTASARKNYPPSFIPNGFASIPAGTGLG